MTKPFLCAYAFITLIGLPSRAPAAEPPKPVFNRDPLTERPYAELPLGAIEPRGWLRDELQRMAGGMTGHLDEWYPEVCGPRNAWLGGDGDTWERGPYWIDGLYPLAILLEDEKLQAKARPWIEWTLNNQRDNGQIGPYETKPEDRQRPAPEGAQVHKPDDWWPRMVMLKILKQHYMATGDERVIDCLTQYFRYQLEELPERPLHDPNNPESGSWWAAQRGGDNLMVVLWLYNITGDKFLLDLAELIHKQTEPATDWFSRGTHNRIWQTGDRADALHCVNLAMLMKTPVVRWQQDPNPRHLKAVETAFRDIRLMHGQPHGLYGGDEGIHGDAPDRGSELCTAVEMMFSLEEMFEITGNPAYGDRLERVAFNALPTQVTDDYSGRQYFQQTNQVQCTFGERDFFNDNGDRVVYGLLDGYPCCTCNLHQGWPKFTQHLWLASNDDGFAALSYAPSSVTANVADGQSVTLKMGTGYPFKEQTTITISCDRPIRFPLHLRIPGWARNSKIAVNGETQKPPKPGTMHVVNRQWSDGDQITLRFPMPVRTSNWYGRSKAIERGPLVYALDIGEKWSRVSKPRPEGVPDSAPDRGYDEVRPTTPWNYALPGPVANRPRQNLGVEVAESIPDNPWTRETSPVTLTAKGVKLPDWTINRNSAAPPPLSPAPTPEELQLDDIRLIPYGATTLRIAAFPWVHVPRAVWQAAAYTPDELKFTGVHASHSYPSDPPAAIRLPHTPQSSADTSIPRWTSWPQRGQEQWVEIEFKETRNIKSLGVYFYDDDRGVRMPKSWHLETANDGQWIETAIGRDKYPTATDGYNSVKPDEPVATDRLRIRMQPQDDKCVGILSVNIESTPPEKQAAKQAETQNNRPNFVFVITDDISPDDLSIYGNDIIKTPHLEALAENGLVFDNAYLTISSCSPSRCSIITGRYPHNTGAPELHTRLPTDQHTFIQSLRQAGYHTILSGKNHMAPPKQLGFAVSSDSHPAGAENWVRHLKERPKDRPFFCWFSSHDAHYGFKINDTAPTYDSEKMNVPPMLYDGPATREELADFYHEVSRTDHYLGEVVKELKRQGIAKSTYIVYCSDNGRPFPRCKTYLYESGIQTPLVIAGPDIEQGRTDSLVSAIDFSATFLDLAGLEKPETVQGASFAPVLRDPSATVRDVAFAERNWHVYQLHERAVRTGDWLYIWNAFPENHNVSAETSVLAKFPAARELWEKAEQDKLTPAQALLTKTPQPEEMLFNVKKDPHQLNNLAGNSKQAETLDHMRKLLDAWKKQTGDSVPEHPTPSRQPLHTSDKKKMSRGDFAGAAHDATTIHHPGPVQRSQKP